MSKSVVEITKSGTKFWRNSKGQLHRTNGPAIEWKNGNKSWHENGRYLGFSDEGFWRLWDRLTPEQKKDPTLLSYLPEKF